MFLLLTALAIAGPDFQVEPCCEDVQIFVTSPHVVSSEFSIDSIRVVTCEEEVFDAFFTQRWLTGTPRVAVSIPREHDVCALLIYWGEGVRMVTSGGAKLTYTEDVTWMSFDGDHGVSRLDHHWMMSDRHTPMLDADLHAKIVRYEPTDPCVE